MPRQNRDEILTECKVSRDNQQGTLFARDSGRTIRVNDTFSAEYKGKPILVGQLGDGTLATIRLSHWGTVKEIEVTYLLKRKPQIPIVQADNPASPSISREESMRICEVCTLNLATLCCNCKVPPVSVCNDRCFFEHRSKNPLIPHSILPMSAAKLDTDEYVRKFSSLKNAAAELRKNVERMDQFELEFRASIDYAISQFMQYKDSTLEFLRAEKERLSVAIEEAIQEAQSCMPNGTQPVSPIAQALLSLPSEKIPLFTHSITPPDVQNICATWVSYRGNFRFEGLRSADCVICKRNISNIGEKGTFACGHICHAACASPSVWREYCPGCQRTR